MTTTPVKVPRKKVVRFYKDEKGEYRWQFRAGNGKKRGNSGEGHPRLTTAEKGAGDLLGGTIIREQPRNPRTGHVVGRPDVRVEYDLED